MALLHIRQRKYGKGQRKKIDNFFFLLNLRLIKLQKRSSLYSHSDILALDPTLILMKSFYYCIKYST